MRPHLDQPEELYGQHLDVLRQRTDAALESAKFDTLAIYSGTAPRRFLDDSFYPYKTNPHFQAWVPLTDASDSWVLYRPGSKPRLVFLQPDDYWHQPPELPSAPWTRHFEICVIREPAQALALLEPLSRCACIGELPAPFTAWGFAAINPDTLLHPLHYQRARKTDYEVACMRAATRRAVQGHLAAESIFRSGGSEHQIHLAYLEGCGHTEAELPYSNIIATNRHAAVLHYQHVARTAEPQDERHTLLIDAGAQDAGYACDITRTHAYRASEFAELISAMDNIQQALCVSVRAGADFAALHLKAHTLIAELLRAVGCIKISAEAAVASGLSGVFFPHGLGHLLGLQVHDIGGLQIDAAGAERARPPGHPYLRLTRTLEPGFVVTIEPGLYFIGMLLEEARSGPHRDRIDWSRVASLQPYGGIRIEDNVLCTAGEPENLTRAGFAAA
jgi:Xaa-Pro dipeptidase